MKIIIDKFPWEWIHKYYIGQYIISTQFNVPVPLINAEKFYSTEDILAMQLMTKLKYVKGFLNDYPDWAKVNQLDAIQSTFAIPIEKQDIKELNNDILVPELEERSEFIQASVRNLTINLNSDEIQRFYSAISDQVEYRKRLSFAYDAYAQSLYDQIREEIRIKKIKETQLKLEQEKKRCNCFFFTNCSIKCRITNKYCNTTNNCRRKKNKK